MSGDKKNGPNVREVVFDEYEEKDDNVPKWKFWHKWCRHGCPFWCKKYFWEGKFIFLQMTFDPTEAY